ncbi:hypothetical protein Tco_0554032 [Tanacetum coccineum]
MSTQQDINAIRAQRLANTHDLLEIVANTQTSFHLDHSSLITYLQHPQQNNNFVPQPSFNTNYMQQPMQNPKDIPDPTTALDMALELMSKAFQLNNTTPTNNNQRSSSNPCYSQIAHSGMNIDQDRQMLMVDDNIAQKEEAGTQLTKEEFDFMADADAYEETERVNANCTLKDNLQQASTSGTQTNKALVYDSYGSAENDSNVISVVSSVKQSGETVEQHPANVEETRSLYDSLYNNLATKFEKVNSVNRNQEKYDKLERCYQKSVYQEQCLTKKINALHLSSAKQITTLNEEIANLNNQLSKEKLTVSFLQEERKKLKNDFKTREDELLDKQIQVENKIKELDNILVKTGQSIQTMHMLSPKPDSFYHTEQEMALGYQNPFYLKQAQQKQQSLYNCWELYIPDLVPLEEQKPVINLYLTKLIMSGSQDDIPPPPPPPSQTPTQQTPHTVSTIKLPILKKGEYDIWAMKMEHYLAHTDYPIWEVIQNGNGPVSITTDTQGQIKVLPPRTAEEILARERERKARTTLLMALPEDHLAKFHKMTDAKEMWEAINLF